MVPFRLIPQPGVPIAEQVVFAAKKAILGGQLRPGDAFPSVRALGRAMKIHANTAQKVVSQLAAEGLIEVLPGIGTVVARPAVRRNGNVRLLARDVEQLAVQAMQIGVSLADLQHAIGESWRRLAGEDSR
ncbi:MAG: GntR family transcriptional regulator [Candidatus Sulfopaludibacter sp.]|nr:GntR family transcriptional regulator [Candidatus Sulfopaludibacter sp.]